MTFDKIKPWLQVVKNYVWLSENRLQNGLICVRLIVYIRGGFKTIMEIGRREFLKYGGAAVIGTVTGVIEFPVAVKVSEAVSDFTGKQEGNAESLNRREQACKETADKEWCIQNYENSIARKIAAVTTTPVLEEGVFRALPSMVLGDKEGKRYKKYPEDMLGGVSPGIGLSRRELLVGSLSLLVFGGAHNITSKGFDTRFIPVTQTLGGMLYWYLQRKFGAISNIAAHSVFNLRAILSS